MGDDERCGEWARAGFCEQESYQAYMEANCAAACEEASGSADAGGGGEPEGDEADTCEQWAAAGYCEQEKYAPYMRENCQGSCGGARGGSAEQGTAALAVEEEEEEEEEDEEDEEEEEDEAGDAAEEPENCAQWARQGLCTDGGYVEYMKLNCKRTCATVKPGDVSSAGVGGGGGERSEEECMGWAARGMCHHPQYSTFMSQSCASVCANIPEVEFRTEVPPPVDTWLILFIVGFCAAVAQVVRYAYAHDVSSSSELRKGKEEVKIGSAIGNQGSSKRSSKSKRA